MTSGEAALARLCDPAAKVSAHWLVTEDGRVLGLVPEERRAWHAGVSAWQGRTGLNDGSVGIEIVNPGHAHGYRPFPEPQIAAAIALCREIVVRHAIPPDRVLAHSDVAPDRKLDPGELFSWPRLAQAGVGLWPGDPPPSPVDPEGARLLLARSGYPIGDGGGGIFLALAAFQRRFRPSRVDGRLDASTMGRLVAVDALYRAARGATSGMAEEAGWPLPGATPGEESPGSTETRCRVTPGGGDPRESATESSPPAGTLGSAGKGERVR